MHYCTVKRLMALVVVMLMLISIVDARGFENSKNADIYEQEIDPITTMASSATDGSWNAVGVAGFSAGGGNYISMAIDGSGTPYVVFQDFSNDYKATVMKYNGSSWVAVGSPGFSISGAYYTSMAIDSNGIPYVAYADDENSGKATVMKYNGSSWATVGSAGFSSGWIGYTSIEIDSNGTPYIAYQDGGNSRKATVMKYNGSSWEIVGSVGFSVGEVACTTMAIDSSGMLYVAYSDWGNSGKATVMKYNGSSWEPVGGAGFSVGGSEVASIEIDNSGAPYVAFLDQANLGKATVMKYNDGSWVSVGSPDFSARGAFYLSMSMDGNGTPYVAYMDGGNANKATVKKYNGNDWVTVGSVGFSTGAAFGTSIAIDKNGTPYVAYSDGGNSNKLTVMNLSYMVTYDDNDATSGSVPIDNGKYVHSADVTVMGNTGMLVKPGYTFAGWNTEADGSGMDYAAGENLTMGDTDIILFAKWTKLTYTITPIEEQTMKILTVGYSAGAQETKTITLERTGTGSLTNLSVNTSGTDVSNFIIAQPTIATLDDNSQSTTFIMKAKDDLAVGIYTATITITADNMTPVTFNVIQAVKEIIGLNVGVLTSEGKAYDSNWTDKDVDITLSGTVSFGIKKYQYSVDNGANWIDMSANSLVIDQTTEATYVFRLVNDEDVFSNTSTPVVIKVDKTKPLIENVTGNPTVSKNTDQVITFTVMDGNSGINKQSIIVKKGDTLMNVTENAGIYSFITQGNGRYSINVSDNVANAADAVLVDVTKLNIDKLSTGRSSGSTGKIVLQAESEEHAPYITGYGDNTFRPDNNIGRAEVAVILARLSSNYNENNHYTNTFTDVDANSWHTNAISFESQSGLVKGYADGSFKPDGNMTRAEFATVIAKFKKLSVVDSSGLLLNDIVGHWADGYIAALYKEGWISGYEDGSFKPDIEITRAEAVKIINAAMGRTPNKNMINNANSSNYANPFSDVDETHWAYYEILEAAISHLVQDFHK